MKDRIRILDIRGRETYGITASGHDITVSAIPENMAGIFRRALEGYARKLSTLATSSMMETAVRDAAADELEHVRSTLDVLHMLAILEVGPDHTEAGPHRSRESRA